MAFATSAAAGGSSTYASDDDPALVGKALPAMLKTIESVLTQDPDNEKLLLAAASGFTQYAYGFVQMKADAVEPKDYDRAQQLRREAVKLYARAQRYGMRGLVAEHEGFAALLNRDRAAAMALADKDDVPLLYWTAAAWGSEISLDKENLALVAQLPEVGALMQRALELDPSYDHGAIHEFYIAYDGGRSAAMGGSIAEARKHFEQAVELSHGQKVGPYVSWAAVVDVQTQNRKEFTTMLNKALAFDVNSAPQFRLINIIEQRRARRLLARADDLFLED